MVTLSTLANLTHGELIGDPDYKVSGVSGLAEASSEHLCFLISREYRPLLSQTKAGVVLLRQDDLSEYSGQAIVCDDPYFAYAQVSHLFDTRPPAEVGINPSAYIAPSAVIAENVSVGPNSVILANARIGEGTVIGAGCYIGHGVVIGERNRIHPSVVIMDHTMVGDDCVFHPSCVVGSDGFGNVKGPHGWVKITQLGRVIIGNRVEIGALTAVDCGAIGDTIIHDGVKLDNLIHIAHNCEIGENSAFAAGVGVAGSTRIGKNSTFAGKVGISGHLTLTDNVHITGMSMVTRSVAKPGVYSSGLHAIEDSLWKKNQARFRRLDEMTRRLIELEKQVENLKSSSNCGEFGGVIDPGTSQITKD